LTGAGTHVKSAAQGALAATQNLASSRKAFAELGKAVKTVFLARYLHAEPLRREIHEGLNVIEQWNGANDFVFFAKRGELASNRHEDHQITMLSLHLLQNCLAFINTLMMQQVLARPHWQRRLTAIDQRALTPLIWSTSILTGATSSTWTRALPWLRLKRYVEPCLFDIPAAEATAPDTSARYPNR